MASTHPYVSAPGSLVQVINQIRSSFPVSVTAETLKKLGFAPKNESYIINILRFLDLIDENGKKTEEAAKIFSIHDDSSFSQAFSKKVKTAYKSLFELHGDKTWNLDNDALITFFRQSDQTSELVGKLQARTFQVLAGFSGHGDIPQPKVANAKKTKDTPKPIKKPKTEAPKGDTKPKNGDKNQQGSVGLTVRIEINLPADGDQKTYDRIFKSIRENLING